MKKLLFIVIFSMFFVSLLNAQEKVKLKKSEFFTTDVGFKDAWKAYQKGNKLYKENKKGSYTLAIQSLKTAVEYNANNASLNYQLGICYIKISDEKNALFHIEEAFNLNPNIASDIHFWLARALHLNNKFDEAIDEYKIYRDGLTPKQLKKQENTLNRYIKECESGKILIAKPITVLINNLGGGVNSPYPEYSPVFAPYDSIVFFTSRRPELSKKRNKKISNEYFEDVYYTSLKMGEWYPPALMPKPINSKGNDASVAINPHGNGILIYRGKKGNGNIFISFQTIKNNGDEKWSKPKQVIRKINSNKSRETSLTFNHDSTMVFFVSNRKKGGYGGKDIWMSKRRGNSNSGWTKPKNIGGDVNTIYDEESVFLLSSDSCLYFASNGHNTMGGFDIFKSYLLPDGRWGAPENVGYPINTAGDDMFIFVNQDRKTGYFCSNGQEENYGDMDLYEYFFYEPKEKFLDAQDELIAYINDPVKEISMEEPVMIKTMLLTVVKGTVTEYETMKPLYANVEIIDNATQETIQFLKTNETTGQYTVMLPSGKDYAMTVSCDGYMFHSENFNIPAASQYQEIIKDIQLLPINPGSKVVLRNVFFDTGKSKLRPESFPELNRLAEVFKLYPNIVIEISGHTDNKGKDAYNDKLSKDRAQAVVDYLVSIGVKPTSLTAKGYGKKQPVADNKTEEGRQLNRRVEAKIISN